jgi:hypothetical protein
LDTPTDITAAASSSAKPAPDEPTHPIARKLERILQKCREDDRGFLIPQQPIYGLPLRVTSTGLPRGVRVLSALVYALEKRGHSVTYLPNEPRPKLIALVDGEEIAFRIAESIRPKPAFQKSLVRHRGEYRTSILTLHLGSVEFSYTFASKRADTNRKQLEDCLEEIVLEFTRTGETIKQYRADIERRSIEGEKRRVLEEEARKQREEYRRKGEVIKKAAQAFETSQSIRRLVTVLGTMTRINELNPDLAVRFKEMLEWCTKHAAYLDPTNRLAGLVEEFFNLREE